MNNINHAPVYVFTPSTDNYGAPKFGYDLVNILASQGHKKVVLVLPTDRPPLEPETLAYINPDVRLHYLQLPILRRYEFKSKDSLKALLRLIRSLIVTRRFVKTLESNAVLHFVSITNLGILCSTKNLGHYKTFSIHEYLTSFEARTIGFLPLKARYTTACSEFIKDQLPDSIRKRIQVVYSGISTSENLVRPEEKSVTKNILCVGRINNWKGQRLLVQAFADSLKVHNVPCHLTIVGSPLVGQEHFLKDLHETISELGLKDRISVFAEDFKIGRYYNNSDIVVVPSIKPEPFGRTTVEALHYGCAVIASKPGGASEILDNGKYGLLFNLNDRKGLSEALTSLLTADHLRERFQTLGPRRADLFLSKKTISKLAIELLRISNERAA